MKGQSYNVGLSEANLSKLELYQQIQRHITDFTFMEAGAKTLISLSECPRKRDHW